MQNLFGEQGDHIAFLYGLLPDIQGVFNVAYAQGTGDALQKIYHVARQHELAITAYLETVYREATLGITPPGHRNDYLLRVRAKPEAGHLKIYVHTDAFSTHFGVNESEVASILGGRGWMHCKPGNIREFVERLDRLLTIIESGRGEQACFSDTTLGDEVEDEIEVLPGDSGDTPGLATCVEGARLDKLVTDYWRNPAVRQACIDIHGTNCVVCGFDFEKVYGDIGADFIHVHHLNPLAEYGDEHEVEPNDLCPVCPNCHNMLHRKTPPFTIEEMRQIIQSR